MSELQIKNSLVRLEKGDITLLNIEAIVFYARNDLQLGSGFGNAITVRGGPSIQEELKSFGTVNTCDAVVTKAGDLKAKYIIHAVGPKFQEADLETKLRKTILKTLQAATEKQIKSIAFPPMGTGFYGIPLNLCAKVMVEEINEFLSVATSLQEVVICVMDNREYNAFHSAMNIKGNNYE